MEQIILVIHVLLAASLIGLVLIQHGKGADMGAAFGSGASGTVFGSQGAGSFLTRSTGVIAALFFATSLTLAYMSGHRDRASSVTDVLATPVATEVVAPATPDVPSVPGEAMSDFSANPAAIDAAGDIPAVPGSVPASPVPE